MIDVSCPLHNLIMFPSRNLSKRTCTNLNLRTSSFSYNRQGYSPSRLTHMNTVGHEQGALPSRVLVNVNIEQLHRSRGTKYVAIQAAQSNSTEVARRTSNCLRTSSMSIHCALMIPSNIPRIITSSAPCNIRGIHHKNSESPPHVDRR